MKFCGAFELALSGHDESESSVNTGIFRGLVDFVASLDGALKEHLDSPTIFKGTSKTVQNELLDCMLSVAREQIIREAQDSDFLSIQADETTDIATLSQPVLVYATLMTNTACRKDFLSSFLCSNLQPSPLLLH